MANSSWAAIESCPETAQADIVQDCSMERIPRSPS